MTEEDGEIYTDSSGSSDDETISALLSTKSTNTNVTKDVKKEESSEAPKKTNKPEEAKPETKVAKLEKKSDSDDESSDDSDSESDVKELKSEDLEIKVEKPVASNAKLVPSSKDTSEKPQSPKRKRNTPKTSPSAKDVKQEKMDESDKKSPKKSKSKERKPKKDESKEDESEPKPKKPRKPKTKTEKTNEGKDEVLTRLSNDQVFKSLKDKMDDLPLGELKDKLLAKSPSESSTDSTLSNDSDEESNSDNEAPLTQPEKSPKSTKPTKQDSDEEVEEVKEKRSDKMNGVKSGDQFINKERLKTTFKTKFDVPEGCEIFCGNIPVESTEDEIRELFEECGKITRVNKLNRKGVAFITFSNEESAKKALDYNNSPYKGQNLSIRITVKKGPRTQKFGSNRKSNYSSSSSFGSSGSGFGQKYVSREATNEICIRNLNFNSSEEGLRELFSECGQVTRCYMPKFHDSGKPMGTAFISFTTVEAAKRAVEYDNTDIDGRTVSIQYALPRDPRSSRGRATKGRFTTGVNKSGTFARSFGQKKSTNDDSNHVNGALNESSEQENKPKSIIFDDEDDE
ncbi:RNA recognition motif family protein [Theileria parva strain Muguga]|uniref:RNA recognition motif family protein n=1 Tax=Theileria parva strain Muguga TaxID=333668 RepID=UPI001C622192|nr:RNA recognition motif family protein [Theileria parva strain Muguga]EAN33091.2 RNA recognition motif family protein [Theileria parva strain Muguga]